MGTNYCPSCGTELSDGANFCQYCGEGLEGTAGTDGRRDKTGDEAAGAGEREGSKRRAHAVAVLMVPAALFLSLAGMTIYSGAAPGPGMITDADWFHWFGWPILGIGLFSIPLLYGHAYRRLWAFRLTRILYGSYVAITVVLLLVGASMSEGYGVRVAHPFNVGALVVAVVVLALVRGNRGAYT